MAGDIAWHPISEATESDEERYQRSLGLFTSACEAVYRVELKYGSDSMELQEAIDFWAALYMRSFPARV